MDKRCRSF